MAQFDWSRWGLAALSLVLSPLTLISGCLMTAGCSKTLWNAEVRDGRMETQFEVSWGTTVKIGFPGQLDFKGEASGESGEPEPATVVVEPAAPKP